MTATLLALALLLDGLLPRRWRPLAGFEWLAARGLKHIASTDRLAGGLAAAALLLPPVWLAAEWLAPASLAAEPWRMAATLLVLAIVIGPRRLHEQVRATGDADAACRKALEAGGGFGVLFWFLVAGLAGALLYRLAATLARRSDGAAPLWAAVWLEDTLNIVPARLAALAYALLGLPRGRFRLALECWREQAPAWPDANAGPPLATGAAVLGIRLEGRADAQGECPGLGEADAPAPMDGEPALALARHAIGFWIAVIGLGELAWWALAARMPGWEAVRDFILETLLA